MYDNERGKDREIAWIYFVSARSSGSDRVLQVKIHVGR